MSEGYVDLKNAKRKDDDAKTKPPTGAQQPDYPYGTRMQLEGDHVKKLYGDDVPEVGEEHEIHARGKIRSVSEDEGNGKRVEIQVTHMKRPKAAPAKERSVRDDVEEAAAKADERAKK